MRRRRRYLRFGPAKKAASDSGRTRTEFNTRICSSCPACASLYTVAEQTRTARATSGTVGARRVPGPRRRFLGAK